MHAVLGGLAFLAFMAFGISQLVAGYEGIAQGLGHIWAVAALVAALAFRFTLPITVGAFFGAMHVWGWPWFAALLFVAPGLLLLIPGTLAAVFSAVRR